MRRVKQAIFAMLCLCMVLAITPVTANASNLENKNQDIANIQEESILNEELYEKWADKSNGKFTSEALKEFALKLQGEYVPRILNGITESFSFAKPTVKGMKMGLELYNDNRGNAALAMVESNGIKYKLSINMAALTATNEGKVDADANHGELYGSIAHELMHAVMFDVTSTGMLGDGYWTNTYHETVDAFPSWFYEGIAQTVGGGIEWCGKLTNDLYFRNSREALIKEWLGEFYYLGYEAYAQGYIAVLYLGHIAGGEVDSITSANIIKGLDAIVLDVEDGYSLSQAICRQTKQKYTSIEDFQEKFSGDAYNFTIGFMNLIDVNTEDVRWHPTGSLLARDGLAVSKLKMYQGLSGESDYFILDITCGGIYDNSSVLEGKNVRTGGGKTKTKGLRRDGTLNRAAKNPWTSDSYKEIYDTEEKQHKITLTVKEGGGGTVTGEGIYKKNASVTVIAKAGEGYKFVHWLENGKEVSTDENYRLTVAGDKALTAVFEKLNLPTSTEALKPEVSPDAGKAPEPQPSPGSEEGISPEGGSVPGGGISSGGGSASGGVSSETSGRQEESIKTSDESRKKEKASVSKGNTTEETAVVLKGKMDKSQASTVSITKGIVQKAVDSSPEGGKGATIVFKVKTVTMGNAISIQLSEGAQKTLLNSKVEEVKVVTDRLQISFTPKALKKIKKDVGTTAVIRVEKIPASMLSKSASKIADKQQIFKIDITNKKGKSVKRFVKSTVSVSIPYALKDNEDKDRVCGVYVTENGKIKKVTGSYYDSTTGMVILDVNQTGVYGIRYQ